jgi:hypothetical protein
MTKKSILGHVTCAVCSFADAEVKADRNGHAYIHCTDCNAQTFTRNDYRDKQLRGRMRPAAGAPTEPTAEPAPEPTAAPAPQPELTEAPTAAPPAPPKPKASFLTPILGS